jgi:hypothetical protein
MGTSDCVLVVVSQPASPFEEQAYNDWYSLNHLNYVLFAERFPSASRFRQAWVVKGALTPYLALYQADWPDGWAAQQAYAEVRRLGIGSRWNRSPGHSLDVHSWSYYVKVAERGQPDPAGDPPDMILVTLAHPDGGMGKTGLFLADEVERWYGSLMDDLAGCPVIRGSTLYRLDLRAGGETPPLYLSVHELQPDEGECGAVVHQRLMAWLSAKCRQAEPGALAGPGAPVGLDFWGYYERLATRHKLDEETLLKSPPPGGPQAERSA